MINNNEIDHTMINKLYINWLNEEDIVIQRKLKKEIKNKISPYELLMYSIRYAIPFEAFRNIFSLDDLFKTLEKMKRQGIDISHITNNPLVIESIEDIKILNKFVRKESSTEIGDFRLKFQGDNIFKYGDIKNISNKFNYTCVNYLDIEEVEQMLKEPKDYKGILTIITIDNIGQLSLEKLDKIEEVFDIVGVRIIEKDREVKKHQGEQTPLYVKDYKQIRKKIDDEIISKLYVNENANQMNLDLQLSTQILSKLADMIEYNSDVEGKIKDKSIEPFSDEIIDVSGLSGLLTGKSICTGYAEILRNVLSCVNIESNVIIGDTTSNIKHAWNQIKIGSTWFNTDFTFARNQIHEGKASGDLFMSDSLFYGSRREMIFDKGKEVNGVNMESAVAIGGHKQAYGTMHKQCDSIISPSVTSILINQSKEYDKIFKRDGKSPDYTGVVLYVGSSVEKIRSSSRKADTREYSEHKK